MADEKKGRFRQSKSDNFLERIREYNPMVEYFTSLHLLNPPAEKNPKLNKPRRSGSFTSLAHAREEFRTPNFTKGKSANMELNSTEKTTS